MKFLPTWPAATGVQGRVTFDQTSLSAEVSSARMANLPINKASARIDDLFNPWLNLSLTSESSLATLVNFSNWGCSVGGFRSHAVKASA